MKRTLALAGMLLAASGYLVSCTPSPASEVNTNGLSVSPKTVALQNAGDTSKSDVALNCGCAFPLYVDSYGDTSVVKYSFNPDTLSTHPVKIWSAKNAAPGVYNSYVAFWAQDEVEHKPFRDTLHVSLTVN